MNDELFEKICKSLESSADGVLKLCRLNNVSTATFYKYLDTHPGAQKRYARAKELQADAIVEEAIDIADDVRSDTTTRTTKSGEEYEVPDSEWINRSRLRVDTRKWLASKLLPKKYGDKLDVEVTDKISTVATLYADIVKKYVPVDKRAECVAGMRRALNEQVG